MDAGLGGNKIVKCYLQKVQTATSVQMRAAGGEEGREQTDEQGADLLAEVRFRNARLAGALGTMSQKMAAEAIGISVDQLRGLLNLRISPFLANGHARPAAIAIANFFCMPFDDVFPPALYRLALPPRIYREFQSQRLVTLQEAGRAAMLPAYSADEPDRVLARLEACREIEGVLESLPARTAILLRKRYGLGEEREHTLEELAEGIGRSKERVHQILSKGLRQLRHPKRIRRLRSVAASLDMAEAVENATKDVGKPEGGACLSGGATE
jgi:hypothetical protein